MQPYEYPAMRAVEDTYWWYVGLHSLVTGEIRNLLEDAGWAQILDVGCGTGGTLQAIHNTVGNTGLVGMDLHPLATELARERNAAALVRGSAERLPFPGKLFDVVLCLDVLYIRGVDERKALAECQRVLRPGGALILNLPAFELLRGEHDLATHTRHRYRKAEVRRLLDGAGFEVRALFYWNALLVPWLALWRPLSLLWACQDSPRSDLKPLPRFLNRALTRMILADIRIARSRSWPFGSSVFGIAAKARRRDHDGPRMSAEPRGLHLEGT